MSQAIYRKYRPKSFSDVSGQGHVGKTLESQIKTGHIVHSYIFTGARGIGKTTIARLLAKSLNCETRKDSEHEPCNECSSCRSINIGNSLNIIEIDAASNTGVDNVRDKIIENVRFAPTGGKYKVFIVDEVHMLSTPAFNALLKTLEEPPAYVVFILATTELHKIPATILSRCQRFDFKKLKTDEVVDRLSKIAKEEDVKIEKSVLERIAYLGEGCLRDAESLFGQLLGLGIKDIKESDADLVLPRGDLSMSLDYLSALVDKNGKDAILLVDKLQEKGVDFKHFIDGVINLTRSLLHLKLSGSLDDGLSSDMKNVLKGLSAKVSAKEIVKILDVMIARREQLNMLDIPSLPLELAAAEICGDGNNNIPLLSKEGKEQVLNNKKENVIKDVQSPTLNKEEVIKPPVSDVQSPTLNKEEVIDPGSRVEARDDSSEVKIADRGDLIEIEDGWLTVLEKIKSYNHSLPFMLSSAKPVGFDGKTLTLAIKFKLHKEKLDDPKNKETLTKVLKSVYNKDIIVDARVDASLSIDIKEESDEVDVADAFGA